MAVCFPLRRRSAACQPWRAKYFAVGALVAAVGKNFHVMWTRGPEFETRQTGNGSTELVLLLVCGRPTPAYGWFEMYVRPWIAFSVVSALPFCIIVFCNVFIVRALIRYDIPKKNQQNFLNIHCAAAAFVRYSQSRQTSPWCRHLANWTNTFFYSGLFVPLCKHMTSSTNPEIYNLLHCR